MGHAGPADNSTPQGIRPRWHGIVSAGRFSLGITMPTFTLLDDGWGRLFWAVGNHVLVEHEIPPESIACLQVGSITALMLFICWAAQRLENWNNEPRHK